MTKEDECDHMLADEDEDRKDQDENEEHKDYEKSSLDNTAPNRAAWKPKFREKVTKGQQLNL